jgi:hypothetical protein
MSAPQEPTSSGNSIPNGPGGAAILAAGVGRGALGILAFAGDASDAIGKAFNIYNPTGTLSGATTGAIVIWLATWLGLSRLWQEKSVAMVKVNTAAFALLILGFLLTFPPVMDLLQGK